MNYKTFHKDELIRRCNSCIALYTVRKNWPDISLTWAIHEQFASLLPGTPWVDDVITIDKKQLKSLLYLYQLRKDLHSRHFDMTLDLQCIAVLKCHCIFIIRCLKNMATGAS